MKHTPTPFKAVVNPLNPKSDIGIIDAQGKYVALVPFKGEGRATEQAAFLVKTANEHETLCDVMQHLAPVVSEFCREISRQGVTSLVPSNKISVTMDHMEWENLKNAFVNAINARNNVCQS